jgi:hypothetical protein
VGSGSRKPERPRGSGALAVAGLILPLSAVVPVAAGEALRQRIPEWRFWL